MWINLNCVHFLHQDYWKFCCKKKKKKAKIQEPSHRAVLMMGPKIPQT